MSAMNTRVIAQMASQGGLVTRLQATEAGMAADQIDRLVRRGVWTVVRKGVYAETSYVASLVTTDQRRLLQDRAASMRIRSPHVLSHHSSAYLLGLSVLNERPAPRTHVTRPGIVGSHQRHGVVHHRAPYSIEWVDDRQGLRCLDAARTVCDIGRDQGFLHGLVAAEAALRTGVTRTALHRAARAMRCWPQVTVVRDVNASASPESDSAGETLAKQLVVSLGFGVPAQQFGLTDEDRTTWSDLRLGRHVFEFDGRVKYQRLDEGGFASSSPEEVVWFEKKRQDWICGFKLGMSRLVWEEVFAIVTGGPTLERVQARLTREYLDTCRRFGTDVTDLARYRPRGDRPRPTAHRRSVA